MAINGATCEQRRIVRVLAVDPELGADLDPDSLEAATSQLIAPVAPIGWARRRGRWGPARPLGHVGLLLVEGMMLREVRLFDTSSAETLGEGDVIQPWHAEGDYELPVPVEVCWAVLAPCEVAILNPQFLRRAAHWPEVLGRLAERLAGRARALALHDAVTNLKHVETRLLVQFWHLAERWGRVGPESIAVHVPLTHEMLAKLIGATRPTVTTGLGRLAARGLLVRGADGVWRLSHESRNAVTPMPIEADTRLVS